MLNSDKSKQYLYLEILTALFLSFFLFANFPEYTIYLLIVYLFIRINYLFPSFLLLGFSIIYEFLYNNFTNILNFYPKIFLISISVIFIKFIFQFVMNNFVRKKRKYVN